MGSRAEKDAVFEAIALMGKAFASPRRLELLDLLAQAPRTVDEHDVAGAQPGDQLVAADRVDLVTEIIAGGALDRRELANRRVAQRQPQP